MHVKTVLSGLSSFRKSIEATGLGSHKKARSRPPSGTQVLGARAVMRPHSGAGIRKSRDRRVAGSSLKPRDEIRREMTYLAPPCENTQGSWQARFRCRSQPFGHGISLSVKCSKTSPPEISHPVPFDHFIDLGDPSLTRTVLACGLRRLGERLCLFRGWIQFLEPRL